MKRKICIAVVSAEDGSGTNTDRPRSIQAARARKTVIINRSEVRPKPSLGTNTANTVTLTSSVDAKEQQFGPYYKAHVGAVQSRWIELLEQSALIPKKAGTVVLEFKLHRDGRVTDMKVVDFTMDEALCMLCQKSVIDPCPFTPWPDAMREGIGAENCTLTLAFKCPPDEIKTGWHTNEIALRDFAWGPPASNGLRAACYFVPAKDGYAVGEELARYRVFYNSAKEPVLFEIRGGGNDDLRTALDEQGHKVPGVEIAYSTIFPIESFRLEPGQVVEMKCAYSTVLVPWHDDRPHPNEVDTVLWARPGSVYHASWKMPVSVAGIQFVLKTGEVQLRIVAKESGNR